MPFLAPTAILIVLLFVIGISQNVQIAYGHGRTCGFENINKFILTHICPCFVSSNKVETELESTTLLSEIAVKNTCSKTIFL